MKILEGAIFLALVIGGVAMTGVASPQKSMQPTDVATEAVVRSAKLFADLKVCEVAGLHEHLLAKGTKTLIYAGEFTPTHATSWTTGTARIFLYVISGTGLIQIGDMSTRAGPGDFFIIPKGIRHAISAESNKLRAVYLEDRT